MSAEVKIVTSEAMLVAQAQGLIASTLSGRDGKAVATVFEVVGIVCSVVEQVAKLSDEKIPGPVKAELAIQIADSVVEALYNRATPLITKPVYEEAKRLVANSAQLNTILAGVVAIAKSAETIQTVERVVSGCSKLFSCCK